jgi:tRNA(adenine34) deaminase
MTQSLKTPMQHALGAAEQAGNAGEVPVGAVIVLGAEIIVTARNRMREMADATAHAEMLAIREALAIVGTGRLGDCDLYVTLEPCTMCAGAIAHARLRRLYFGAEDKKAGAVENGVRFFDQPSCHHRPEIISGIGATASSDLLRSFFAVRR